MRINRRGSVNMEAVMVIPIAVIMILLGRFVLEASLNRQETAIFVRGSAVSAAYAGPLWLTACEFERDQFNDHPDVDQTANVLCSRRDAERQLSDEQPMWDEVEDGAAPWQDILRDVMPSNSARDIIGNGYASVSISRPNFLSQQRVPSSFQRYIAPEEVLWVHSERGYDSAHNEVIWDEICSTGGTYWLFPNVFPENGGPRC